METSSIIDSGAAQKIVSKYLGGGELVLDLGCGSGKFCGGLENCVGYDLPELDLNKDKIPHPDSSFDIVAAWNVIEHLENPHHFAREAQRVLKSAGLLFVATPNIFNLANKYFFLRNGEMRRFTKNSRHKFIMTKSLVKNIFDKFSVLEVGFHRAEYPYWIWFLDKFRLAPREWNGKTIYYVFKKL
ncbi:hypothetical protein A2757_00555 [Candidatus Giovannonibacteria bacterium RIFCSPHIGHO2_01_FULL_48_47]|nr:MAG: hypothetical protein A2757_00555 [Candidatus Giovannonibacteria bacterium RIFCSPHIGHO2_01_FULL_48_47]OGF68359.1 MAG: hypothetical protein A3D61_00555 [Candidatus Giovannonibacteria bacterium RIFCSPHIGHO2_02_FULL_48_15]OGF89977.1 MAG: hypothetical protein A3B26_01065 [Candidatus Giovannonibacteria bacterium RIFCSPLOWO2_01_FULL_48_47]OGF95534.1 MAG: hypothetical protein A2433_02275 [Candidatus Giovannonibacteria bacterium RIFOXYC1_FULL_48_8]OGF96186.1 MAG: hypothetical protein A2613_01295